MSEIDLTNVLEGNRIIIFYFVNKKQGFSEFIAVYTITWASTQEKKSGVWDDQSPDRELVKGLSRDCVLRRRVTGPRESHALHVHRQYGHMRPWWKSLGGFHFPLVGPAEFFNSLENSPETYHRRFANVLIVNEPQYYYCSSRIQPDDDTDTCGLYCLYYFKRRHRGMELPDIVKDFSTVDLR